MITTIFERNMKKLMKLAPEMMDLKENQFLLRKSGPYMDLYLEAVAEDDKTKTIRLAHYFRSRGDVLCDPQMTLKIHKKMGWLEALDCRDTFGFKRSYTEDGEGVYVHVRKDLNNFLGKWLSNCKEQGHKLEGDRLLAA